MGIEQLCCLPSLFIQILYVLHMPEEGKLTSTSSNLSLLWICIVVMVFTMQRNRFYPSLLTAVSYIQMLCVRLAVGSQCPGADRASFRVRFVRTAFSQRYVSTNWLFCCWHIYLVQPWFRCLADSGQFWHRARGQDLSDLSPFISELSHQSKF